MGSKPCKCPTSFPCPSALGAAFNDSLYFLIGQADGREARAINNLRNHATQNVYGDGIDYWSPTINMQRDPRWGRNQEVPGEELVLLARQRSTHQRVARSPTESAMARADAGQHRLGAVRGWHATKIGGKFADGSGEW